MLKQVQHDTLFSVTLNLFQGLQFEGVKNHPLNAPPKKTKTKEEMLKQVQNDGPTSSE